MNTSNTFLRYFQEDKNGNEVNETFVSISQLDYSGAPIDAETGDDFDRDESLYKFNGVNKYEKIS